MMVDQSLTTLGGWLTWKTWPSLPCPACKPGHLVADQLQKLQSASSRRAQREHGGYPGLISGTFYGTLKCSRTSCHEVVVVCGDFAVEQDYTDKGESYFVEYLRLGFATPPVRIIAVPDRTPKTVVRHLEAASQILWCDPGAAAMRLRLAIDTLLTARRVPRTLVDGGKRRRLDTHRRIALYKSRDHQVGETLEAVKWIGNQGVHEDTVKIADVLEGAELLGIALNRIYDPHDRQVERRIKEINRARGVRRRKSSAK